MSNQNLTHVVTGKVRLSYVHLFTPFSSQQGQEPKFSTTLLIPKSDIATRQRIDAAINAAIQQGVSEKFGGVRPPMLAIPIHDGDGVRPSDGMPFGEECKGHWVITASSKSKPEIVDLNLNPIINQTEVYSGMYARVSIRFFPFNSQGKKGVGCGLGNVQKLEDGEPLGGRTSATSDFGGATGAPGAYPPPAYTAPPAAPAYNAPPAQYPGYGQPAYAPPAAPNYQQPGYGQPAYAPPVQHPGYQQQPAGVDPITGAPLGGSVYGI